MWVNLVTKQAILNIRVSKIQIDKGQLRLGDFTKDISNACFQVEDIMALSVKQEDR